MPTNFYDAIVVGGGPAGCVLAARLSEDPDRSVLLIEAGPDYGPNVGDWPEEMISFGGTLHFSHTWGYYNAADATGHRMHIPRARVLGGCSAVNGCVWLRGSRADYDHWAALGNPGWGFDDLLPYFRRAETDPCGEERLHGRDGPIPIRRVADDNLSPFDRAIVAGARQLGIPYVDDLNGAEEQVPSVGKTPKNAADGIRYNAALTHLARARSRPNLTVLADSLVDRVTFDGHAATGVRTADGREIAAREIILACGAYNTPTVLLRSGIGPADHLREMGIDLLADLPGVGENLMDHPVLMRDCRILQFAIAEDHAPSAPSFGQIIVKARSRQVASEIDLHLTPVVEYDDAAGVWTLLLGISLQYARSTGRVRLASPDPETPPAIDLNYFSHPADLEALCDGVELARRLAALPPLAALLAGQLYPNEQPVTRDELRRLIRARVQTTHHPSTTCKMGPKNDPMAVVDQMGRVRGTRRLWIADPSIFPFGPRANIHCATVAVAERITDCFRQHVPARL